MGDLNSSLGSYLSHIDKKQKSCSLDRWERERKTQEGKGAKIVTCLFAAGNLNDRSIRPTTFICLDPKLKMRGAVSPFAHAISYCDFLFSRSFNDIFNFSGYAESKSKLIARQRV
jgi:hypothetical protein